MTSGFPLKKELGTFDFDFQPSIDKRQIEELAAMRFLENGENVVFLGPPGVGRTHLATALGMVAASHRKSTCYINCHQLTPQLKAAHFANRLPEKLKILAKYSLLIIDGRPAAFADAAAWGRRLVAPQEIRRCVAH